MVKISDLVKSSEENVILIKITKNLMFNVISVKSTVIINLSVNLIFSVIIVRKMVILVKIVVPGDQITKIVMQKL